MVKWPKRNKPPVGRQVRPSSGVERGKVVFSYYGSGNARPTGEGRGETRPDSDSHVLQRITTGALVVVIAASAAYNLLLDSRVRLLNVATTSSLAVRPVNAYEEGLRDILAGSVFNKTKLTINPAKVEEEFLRQFPEVVDLDMALPLLGQRPTAQLEFAMPHMLVTGTDGVYVVDERGRVLMDIRDVAKTAQLDVPTVQDESGLPVTPGLNILTSDEASFIWRLSRQFKEKGIAVQSIVLPAIPKELHVRIDGQPYYIKFLLDGDSSRQFGAFVAVRSELEGQGNVPAEYIDVRVEDRVFVK